MSDYDIVLVTGASGVLGASMCRALASPKRRIIATYHHNEKGAQSLVDEGVAHDAVLMDLADAASIEQAIEGIAEKHGDISVLVNNAGCTIESPAPAQKDEDWDQVIATNLSGAFRCCRAVAMPMIRARAGRIVNVSSVVARIGGRGQIAYAASKGGLEAMTRTLALELAPRGILVNAVAPGVVKTPMSEDAIEDYGDRILKRIPLKRLGTPDEIAAVVAFLCGPNASYITGQVIAIDGGMGLGV